MLFLIVENNPFYSSLTIKNYLSREIPLIIGMPIYSNFLKTQSNPKLTLTNEDDILLGGFVGIIVGYQEVDQHFIVKTTKGKRWGERGYVFIPYKQILDKGAEIVALEIMEELVLLDIEKHRNRKIGNNPETINNGIYTSETDLKTNNSLKTVF